MSDPAPHHAVCLLLRRVMKKVGMRCVRSFRLSNDDLARADTYCSAAAEV